MFSESSLLQAKINNVEKSKIIFFILANLSKILILEQDIDHKEKYSQG